MKISQPYLYYIVCSLTITTVPSTGETAILNFNPIAPVETYESDFFDDDVDVNSGPGNAPLAEIGDVINWDYLYTGGNPGYKVTSFDEADIDLLQLFGLHQDPTKIKVELQFAGVGGALFGPIYTMNPVIWQNNMVVVEDVDILPGQYEGDDALGVLGGKTICGFRMQITLLQGLVSFNGADFRWEADTIEKVSCGDTSGGIVTGDNLPFFGEDRENLSAVPVPAAGWLFGSGLIGLVGVARRKKA